MAAYSFRMSKIVDRLQQTLREKQMFISLIKLFDPEDGIEQTQFEGIDGLTLLGEPPFKSR
jgi:hypothetical protein